MIGQIKGILIEKQAPSLVLDVAGLGYEIESPMSTFYELPPLGDSVTLFTHFVVREDAQLLYGFRNKAERALFRALIKVNGVGPKLALTILSGIDGDSFIRCVEEQDTQALIRLPGVGKKTAERLLVEMKDRLQQLKPASASTSLGQPTASNSAQSAIGEAESALIALGFKATEAARAVAAINSAELTSEQIIRQALKNMVTS